jgi:hypothetical protein
VGIIDYYEPVPALSCPVCGEALSKWQGRYGEPLWFVWRQGRRAPVDWVVDEEVQAPGTREAARLPPAFEIGSWDEAGHTVIAAGEAPDGIWTTTTIVRVLLQRRSRKGQLFTRLLWGIAPLLPKAARDR